MTEDQFNAEKTYQAAISIAKTLRSKGLLTEEEYTEIDTKLKAEYAPIIGTLLSENPLLS